MLKKNERLGSLLIICPIILGVAYGGRSTMSAAPSEKRPAVTPSAPASNVTSATIAGVVSGVSGASGHTLPASDASPGITVTVVGTTISAGIDSPGSFTLTGVAPSDVVLRFAGPGIDAALSLGLVAASDHLEISVTFNGTTATLDHQQRTGSDNMTDADGQIDNIAADARRFALSGSVIDVPAGAKIRRDGAVIGFSDLKRGDRAHVRGVKQESGTIASASVDVVTPAQTATSGQGAR